VPSGTCYRTGHTFEPILLIYTGSETGDSPRKTRRGRRSPLSRNGTDLEVVVILSDREVSWPEFCLAPSPERGIRASKEQSAAHHRGQAAPILSRQEGIQRRQASGFLRECPFEICLSAITYRHALGDRLGGWT
jgi:hypothetical protein